MCIIDINNIINVYYYLLMILVMILLLCVNNDIINMKIINILM